MKRNLAQPPSSKQLALALEAMLEEYPPRHNVLVTTPKEGNEDGKG